MPPLLAKSSKDGRPGKPLVEHTRDVLDAAAALFGREGAPTRLARSWLHFFGLEESDQGRFLRHLRVSAAAHDWGKANDGFQRMLAKDGEQAVRHEHLSGLLVADLLSDKAVVDWLRGAGLDEVVVLAAVISHHVKAGPQAILRLLTGVHDSVTFCSDHDDFAEVWRMIQREAGSPYPASVRFPTRWRKGDLETKGVALEAFLTREKKKLRDDPIRRRWVAAVRAGLIVADSVGSAVVRMEHDGGEGDDAAIGRWVADRFSNELTGREVWEEVTSKRVADLRKRNRWNDTAGVEFGGSRGFSRFQVDVAGAGPRVLLAAPCGSGKTLAAWNWIKAQLDRRPAARVLFLYPTRATATEGFRDYVSWAPGDDAGLLSGTADYELQDMFKTPDDPNDPRGGRDYRPDPRLYALGHWKKRIVSATADQFFPFMQYGYGPLCLLPMLAESVVVVDEVHSFDKSMFSTLKRFLVEFPTVPVLCMTATLGAERRAELVEDCKLNPHPETLPPDAAEDAGHPRYHVEWVDRDGATDLAVGALHANKRVLWVSNRVSDCQDVYRNVARALPESTPDEYDPVPRTARLFCYHSRFKLEDRKRRHADLVRAFQNAAWGVDDSRGLLGATTQVCEMSLDLDAEVLVTELAPIASLIQRMGRCNRDSKAMKADKLIGRVYVVRPRPGREKPYEKKDLDAAREFVDRLAGKDVSQDELEAAYRACDPSEHEPLKVCPFLDSGPFAEADQAVTFRDADDYAVQCVLEGDVPTVLERIADREPIDGLIVPVPRWSAKPVEPERPRFPRWLWVAQDAYYERETGFREPDRSANGGQG